MATYKFTEENLLPILGHFPVYGITVLRLSSEIIDNTLFYTIEVSDDIPEEELPHLIEGNGLQVL